MDSAEVAEMLYKLVIINSYFSQFSKYCNKVYAIDIDPNKIEICKNNTQVYQCEDNIEFILSDYLMMENKIKVCIYY